MSTSGEHPAPASLANNRLAKSLDHVQKYWIPINPVAFKHIHKGFRDGRYIGDRAALSKDLKSDLSLYTYCIRRICEIFREESGIDFDPLKIIEELDVQDIEAILDVDIDEISVHSLETSNQSQVNLLQDALLGACAAEVAAEQTYGDKRAFGATVLRQLGLTLIAWNYESIFSDVAEKTSDPTQMDTALSERLGFSPELLASCVVQSWGVSAQKCYSIGLKMNPETGKYEEIKPRDTEQEFLWKVCELGEQLARANDPERYPKAKADWKKIEKSYEQMGGHGAIATIRRKFEHYCMHYVRKIPSILKGEGVIFNRERYPSDVEIRGILKNNHFINECSPATRMDLEELYLRMDKNKNVDQDKIRFLIKQIIPSSGIRGGAVFIFDPTLSMFVPQLKFGEVELQQTVSVDYTVKTERASIIASAYQRTDPESHTGESLDGKELFGIAGTIGKSRKMGVLYVEGLVKQKKTSFEQHMVHFQAFRRALTDCLQA